MDSLIRKPSAWVPIAMSGAMLAFILGYLALYGLVQEPAADEGAPARLFQLWMAAEPFAILYFAATWMPRIPKEALHILFLQILSALIPLATVFFLEL